MMKIIQFGLVLLLAFGMFPTATWAEEDLLILEGEIVFRSERDNGYSNIYTMDADGSHVERLTDFNNQYFWVQRPQWSADGTLVTYLWYNEVENGIGLIRADGVTFPSLVRTDGYEIGDMAWSPDGLTLIFKSYESLCFFTATLTVQDRLQCITHDGDPMQPTWSPDSMRLAYANGDWREEDIYTVNRDGTNVIKLTNHSASDIDPAWSPDGTQVVFASNRNGNYQLFVMESNGDNVQQLTARAADDRDPAWSPDGNYIAFTRTFSGGNSEIFVMKANGSGQTRLTNSPGYDGQPDWKPASQMNLQRMLLLSSSTGGKVEGIPFHDEDILAFDLAAGIWSLYFDGSDVGLTTDVDALSIAWDGTLIMSLNVPTTVPGLGLVDDSDLIRFVPSALGPTTAGTFTYFAKGSELGLTTNGEDIDALYSMQSNFFDFSTIGRAKVSDLIAEDEDIIQYDYQDYGLASFRQSLDGSAIKLMETSEDIWGITRDGDQFYFTTAGPFAIPGLRGDGADIVELTPDPTTNEQIPTLYWDGSQHGFDSEVIDALEIVYVTTMPINVAAANGDEMEEVGDTLNDDVDETVEEETTIFLPLINHK